MLDIEVVTAPTKNAFDIVTLDEMKAHLRKIQTRGDDQVEAAIFDAVSAYHGIGGMLRRTLLPTTYRYYRRAWPDDCRTIKLPFPPLLSVDSVGYDNGASPGPSLASSDYIVKRFNGDAPGELVLLDSVSDWPTVSEHPRAVTITFTAGYDADLGIPVPDNLKRLIKFQAAAYYEGRVPTLGEGARSSGAGTPTKFALDELRNALIVPASYDDWE